MMFLHTLQIGDPFLIWNIMYTLCLLTSPKCNCARSLILSNVNRHIYQYVSFCIGHSLCHTWLSTSRLASSSLTISSLTVFTWTSLREISIFSISVRSYSFLSSSSHLLLTSDACGGKIHQNPVIKNNIWDNRSHILIIALLKYHPKWLILFL